MRTSVPLLDEHANQQAALTVLRSHRYDSLLDRLVQAARAPVFADDAPSATSMSACRFARTAARAQFRRLQRGIKTLSNLPTDAELHRVRILAKRSRYAMNAAALVIGAPAAKHAAAVAGLQTVLGDLHDAVVAEQWLRTTAAAYPACGVAAGQLVAIERAEAAQLRENWRHTWRAGHHQETPSLAMTTQGEHICADALCVS